jgi:hypothetical protein
MPSPSRNFCFCHIRLLGYDKSLPLVHVPQILPRTQSSLGDLHRFATYSQR